MRNQRGQFIKVKIGLKYCGGCNPLYDRVAAVRYMEEQLHDVIRFVSPHAGDCVCIVVVVGCPTACVDVSQLRDTPLRFITGFKDAQDFVKVMKETGVRFSTRIVE